MVAFRARAAPLSHCVVYVVPLGRIQKAGVVKLHFSLPLYFKLDHLTAYVFGECFNVC